MTDEYKQINRFGKVPCINDNGHLLAEAPAILQYLLQKHESTLPEHWYPRDIKTRSRVNEFLSWQHLNIRMNSSIYVWMQFIIPMRFGEHASEQSLTEARTKMIESLDFIEHEYLKNNRYIAGTEKISIADLLLVAEIQQIRKIPRIFVCYSASFCLYASCRCNRLRCDRESTQNQAVHGTSATGDAAVLRRGAHCDQQNCQGSREEEG